MLRTYLLHPSLSGLGCLRPAKISPIVCGTSNIGVAGGGVAEQRRGKIQAGRYKVTLKRNRPLTYEQSNKPCYIATRKSWNSWNTSSLVGVTNTPEVVMDDVFIRSFLHGTWHRLFLSEIIIKRRANTITIAGIVHQAIAARKFYFLIGYTEELLSRLLKCPVKMDIQTTSDKHGLIYKYI